jgi:hypothetical protein
VERDRERDGGHERVAALLARDGSLAAERSAFGADANASDVAARLPRHNDLYR